MRRLLSLALTMLVLSACDGGSADGEGEGGGEGGGEGAAWIVGAWSGNVRGKGDEGGEGGGANLVETTVDAKFKGGDNAKTGTFTFTMPQLKDVVVEGTFADFAGKSLLLTIKKSNFSALGMPGNTTDLDYELTGDALELSNRRIVLKLLRTEGGGGEGDGEGGDSGDAVPEKSYPGAWSCYDKAGRTWQFSLSGGGFDVKVFDPPTPALLMSGEYAIDTEYAVLTVTDSNQVANAGIQFLARLTDDKTLAVTRLIRQDNDTSVQGETFNCNRQ